MAGAGYKLFNTGDVLTAAQVNTYLQEQVVMVFADAAARTTALSGVLAEGMLSYLKDTDAVQYYNGSSWTTINTDQTPLTTKGDLFTYSTTDARLAVGNNGETLVADSSTSTGLRWQGIQAAGRNVLINADFSINQRNSGVITTSSQFPVDRFSLNFSGGSCSAEQKTFAAGSGISGLNVKNYLTVITASQSAATDFCRIRGAFEDVYTFAGETVTFSFYAKAASGTPKVTLMVTQNFGTGGSASVDTKLGDITLSTSWTRYSITATMPSISGKTIGTSNYNTIQFFVSAGASASGGVPNTGIQNNTFDIAAFQLERGSVATPFTTATGTFAGELAACQRYYFRATTGAAYGYIGNGGSATNTTTARTTISLPVAMRARPTAVDYGGAITVSDGVNLTTPASITIETNGTTQAPQVVGNMSSGVLTQYRWYCFQDNNAGTAYLGLSAEL